MNAKEKAALFDGAGQVVKASQNMVACVEALQKGEAMLAGIYLREAQSRIKSGLTHLNEIGAGV